MTHLRWLVVAVAFLAPGCAARGVREPLRPGQDLVVLLPDPDGDSVGKASASNNAGAVMLEEARDATLVTRDRRPAPPVRLRESAVRRLFSEAIAALPPAPQQFTLFFRFESEELTDESRAMVVDVLRAVKERPVPDVSVVGHTDTTGTPETNFDLGLRRANTVRSLLIQTGLSASAIDIISHGEVELLVPTSDGVFEPRNRRVEVTVR